MCHQLYSSTHEKQQIEGNQQACYALIKMPNKVLLLSKTQIWEFTISVHEPRTNWFTMLRKEWLLPCRAWIRHVFASNTIPAVVYQNINLAAGWFKNLWRYGVSFLLAPQGLLSSGRILCQHCVSTVHTMTGHIRKWKVFVPRLPLRQVNPEVELLTVGKPTMFRLQDMKSIHCQYIMLCHWEVQTQARFIVSAPVE